MRFQPMLFPLIFAMVVVFTVASSTDKSNDNTTFIVGGYLPDYRVDHYNLTAALPYLTDVVLFSIEANKYGLASAHVCCLQEGHYQKITKQARNKVKLWVSVGGAGRSRDFFTMASSPNVRQRFLENVKNLCIQYSLDGVDFDWEQPTTQQEYQSYMDFLVLACQFLHAHGLLVSVATRQAYFPPKVVQELDRFHVMAYQLSMQTYHADYTLVADYMEQQWLQSDADGNYKYPPHKLVLGIPAFGQELTTGQMDKTYSELVVKHANLHDLTVAGGYQLESPNIVQKKVQLAQQHGLGGVFFWELGQDLQESFQNGGMSDGGVLLQAAAEAAATSPPTQKDQNHEEL